MRILFLAAMFVIGLTVLPAEASAADFGPSNPFYAASTLPFQAPPFDKIKDADYQPAIEAGMAQELKEIQAIANNPQPPTFENTFIPVQKAGRLLRRALPPFEQVAGANSNPTLLAARAAIAPQLAAHQDAIFLDEKHFQRVKA